MKKFLLINILTILSVVQTFADGTLFKRKRCVPVVSWKYIATAKVTALHTVTYPTGYNSIGQLVGSAPKNRWTTKCFDDNKGCNQQSARCSSFGTVTDIIINGLIFSGGNFYYEGEALAEYRNNQEYYIEKASGRGSAGSTGEYNLNDSIFRALNDQGYSNGELTGNINIVNDNTLQINRLSGQLVIQKYSDYFTKFRVLIIKEDTNLTEELLIKNDSLISAGIYKNVVDSAEFSIQNGKITYMGLFENINSSQINDIGTNNEFGIEFSDLTLSIPLTYKIREGEILSIATIIDGGFDISSAIIGNFERKGVVQKSKTSISSVKIYPTIAKNNFSLEISSEEFGENFEVTLYDSKGKKMKTIYEGTTDRIALSINNINISEFSSGLYFVETKIGNKIYHNKLVIQQ